MMQNNKTEFDDAWLGLGDLTKILTPNNPMIHRVKS